MVITEQILNMADDSDDTHNMSEKIILSKENTKKKSKQIMMKYYNDPEKQTKLKERIKEYRDMAVKYRLKADELEQFVLPQN
jgi:DNA repair ATPase RecN